MRSPNRALKWGYLRWGPHCLGQVSSLRTTLLSPGFDFCVKTFGICAVCLLWIFSPKSVRVQKQKSKELQGPDSGHHNWESLCWGLSPSVTKSRTFTKDYCDHTGPSLFWLPLEAECSRPLNFSYLSFIFFSFNPVIYRHKHTHTPPFGLSNKIHLKTEEG